MNPLQIIFITIILYFVYELRDLKIVQYVCLSIIISANVLAIYTMFFYKAERTINYLA